MEYVSRHVTPPQNTNLVVYCPGYTCSSYVICTYDERGFRYRGSYAIDAYIKYYAVLDEME